MMKNKYTIFLLILAFFTQVYSQEQQNKYKTGVRTGLNISSVEFKNDETDNSILFHAGMVFDIMLKDLGFGILYFQPGAMFSSKGGEISDNYESEKYEEAFSLNYLEVPLLASLKVPINESISVRANAGAYIAFGLLGTWESKVTEDGETHSDETSSFGKDKFGRLDFGLNFGGGVEYSNFYAGLAYEIGLANIADNSNSEASNSVLGITLGYNF